MKKYFFNVIIILIMLTNAILSQDSTFCGTVASSPDYLITNNIQLMKISNQPIAINVFIHKVAMDNGSYAITTTEVNNAMNILNSDYADFDISFILVGTDQINNTAFFNSPNENLFNVNPHSDAIDIYLIPEESTLMAVWLKM